MQYSDFDLDGRVRVPIGFYLVLLYLMRGYFIWIMSLTHRNDPTLILSLIYSDNGTFYQALTVGLPAFIFYGLFLSKGRVYKSFESVLWKKSLWVIGLTLLADLALQIVTIYHQGLIVHWLLPLNFILGVYLTWYWMSSKRVKRFVKHWLG